MNETTIDNMTAENINRAAWEIAMQRAAEAQADDQQTETVDDVRTVTVTRELAAWLHAENVNDKLARNALVVDLDAAKETVKSLKAKIADVDGRIAARLVKEGDTYDLRDTWAITEDFRTWTERAVGQRSNYVDNQPMPKERRQMPLPMPLESSSLDSVPPPPASSCDDVNGFAGDSPEDTDITSPDDVLAGKAKPATQQRVIKRRSKKSEVS